ncbi:MAG: hypothetical protein GTN89_10795 [Acidobacteria bacterium]|nr:hypothetical protein [Acidobacteriota bacterium]NIM63817.1 hypothetical protein [Acidobacteriota bacterium]NIO59751.1 hypothetical protein [Acidobacteriota bacterium]NIQ30834.1 hypothetical protein [Acidobacteriota bacterium]NIQ85907.1 hypothetical protein [Acidobacteriota bacterium]
MKTTLETPSQMLERLERMGLDRVKALLEKDHFDPKTIGLVAGWIKRKQEEENPAPTAPPADEVAREALKIARQAAAGARQAHVGAAKAQRMATIGLAVAGAATLVAILTLFAAAIG